MNPPTHEQRSSTLGRPQKISRQRIIEVAARLFKQKGFHATNLEAVAAELHVSRPALYYHFRSKGALLEAIYVQGVDILNSRAAGVLSEHRDPVETLRLVVAAYLDTMLDELDIVSV